MFNYNKIIVIGCSGSGKTTFSLKLAKLVSIPLYHLDGIYWKEDATHITRRKLKSAQKKIFKNDKWIIDGNFRSTLEMRIKEAELIFFFDIDTADCLNGAINRVKNKEERVDLPCELPVNDELITFIKNFNTDVKPLILKYFKKYHRKEVVTFHSRAEADVYIEKLSEDETGGRM